MLNGLFHPMDAVRVRHHKFLRLDDAEEELQLEETQTNESEEGFEVFLPA